MIEYDSLIERINKYTLLDNSEQSEVFYQLEFLYQSYRDYMRDELIDEIVEEFKQILYDYETHYDIVEEKTIVPQRAILSKRLELK